MVVSSSPKTEKRKLVAFEIVFWVSLLQNPDLWCNLQKHLIVSFPNGQINLLLEIIDERENLDYTKDMQAICLNMTLRRGEICKKGLDKFYLYITGQKETPASLLIAFDLWLAGHMQGEVVWIPFSDRTIIVPDNHV
jgi:hypothetical protein